MTVFITAVLVAAALQSFCKLSLLPRKWEFLAGALLIPLPFLFEGRIAQTGMQSMVATLSSAATLENWCAMVVIQELFTLVIGFSLLSESESGGRIRKWKYLVFLPSVLLPAGALYLQMYLFNTFPNQSFDRLTWLLAAGMPLALVATAETARVLRRDREKRILLVLHAEYFLVLPAIFLPVAATARLMQVAAEPFPYDALITLGALGAFVIASTIGFQLYHLYKRKKSNAHRLSNS